MWFQGMGFGDRRPNTNQKELTALTERDLNCCTASPTTLHLHPEYCVLLQFLSNGPDSDVSYWEKISINISNVHCLEMMLSHSSFIIFIKAFVFISAGSVVIIRLIQQAINRENNLNFCDLPFELNDKLLSVWLLACFYILCLSSDTHQQWFNIFPVKIFRMWGFELLITGNPSVWDLEKEVC